MIRTRRSHLLAATALASALLGVTLAPQSARAVGPVVGAGCLFAGNSGGVETFVCSGTPTPFITSNSTSPEATRQIILANEFVTATGIQAFATNQNIIIDQVPVLGAVQQPVPDI